MLCLSFVIFIALNDLLGFFQPKQEFLDLVTLLKKPYIANFQVIQELRARDFKILWSLKTL